MTRNLIPAFTLTTLAGLGALAVLAGGTAAVAQEAAQPAPAADPRAEVERLIPALRSDSPRVREDAERALFALGEAGRAELDRMTRDPDPQRAVLALKYLQSPRWDRAPAGESPVRRVEDGGRETDLEDLGRRIQEQVDREVGDIRLWIEDFEQALASRDWAREWLPEMDVEERGLRASSSGTRVVNGRSFAWSLDADGKVVVRIRENEGAEEKVYEAPNVDALRKEHPEVARELDAAVPRGRRFTFAWPPRAREHANGNGLVREGEERLTFDRGEPVPPGPMLGIVAAPVPEVLREQLDLPQGGVVVESVSRGTLAERLGLRRHDVLLRVAGRDVAAPADIRKALETATDGTDVAVEILRKGRREILLGERR